ncbi:MAG: outer membrane protein [Flavobacteriaceae bacterium]
MRALKLAKYVLAAGILSVGLLGGKAMAADPAMPYAPVDWSGWYVGVHAGGAWGNVDFNAAPYAGPVWSQDLSGFGGGVLGGYNWQSGQFVFGAEIDATWFGADSTLNMAPFGFPGTFVTAEYDALYTARARAGIAYDRWMPYVTAGIGLLSMSGAPSFGGTFDTDNFGFVGGAGLEMLAFGDRATIRVEWLHGEFSYETAPPFADSDPSVDIIRAALTYRFGH